MDILNELNLSTTNHGGSGGKQLWCHTEDHGAIESINPATEDVIATVFNSSASDYHQLVGQAQQAAQAWRRYPAPKRGEVIRHLADLLRAKKHALGSLISLETGKSLAEGEGEVQEMIDMADLAVGLSRQLYGCTMHSERPGHRLYEQWHPLGVVGVITAFNFPAAVWSWNAFVAAVCGNTVVWKGSPLTPLCTLAIQHLCNDAMSAFDLKSIFNCWNSNDINLHDLMPNDTRIALLSFTGSSRVGTAVAQQVTARAGKVLLECSGNNAIIVDDTADLQLAIPAITFGAVGTAGQRCTTTRRVFIHDSQWDALVTGLQHAYQQITIGDPLDASNLMGPLIHADAVTAYEAAIEQIKEAGGTLLYGGQRRPGPGYYVEPTLVTAHNHWDIVQQETFGPILYLIKFNELDEAIQMNNASCYGLSSALFTQRLQNAEQFLSSCGSDCGLANINIGTSGAEIGGAFGGEKATGGGREAGSDAWKAYMRRQTVTINHSDDLPLAQGIRFEIS